MGSCSATSETHNKRKNAHTADDINFSSLFFEICFLLFGLLFFPFSAGRSEERGVGGLAAGLGRRWRSERERRSEVALVLARSDALASWRLVQEEGAEG